MSDEFGQFVKGLHLQGDTIVSTDSHPAVFGKKGTTYEYLELDASSGGLNVEILTADVDIRDLSHTQDSVKVGDGTDFLEINSDGSINIGDISAGTQTNDVKITLDGEDVNVTATDLDIRDLVHTQDSVALGDGSGVLVDVLTGATIDALQVALTDGTDQLAINSDGSINVSMTGAGASNDFIYGSANLVKDTLTTVVSLTPGVDTDYVKSILVSGAGLCEWQVLYGTTSSEAVIASFWTTPASPTYHYDIPDSLNVTTAQTIIVKAYNREKAASAASDFTGHATISRQD